MTDEYKRLAEARHLIHEAITELEYVEDTRGLRTELAYIASRLSLRLAEVEDD